MNEAEKFLKGNIKTVTIGDTSFRFRKINPKEVYLMNQNLIEIRRKHKELEKELEEDCEDCEEEKTKLNFSMVEIQELADMDTRVLLTNCVLNLKIVSKPYGEQGKDEIPFDLIDHRTATTLFAAIQEFSLEVFEGVSLESFPDEQAGSDIDGDKHVLEHPSQSVGGQVSVKYDKVLEDEVRRILREGEEDGVGDEATDRRSPIKKDKKAKRRVRKQKVRKKDN